MVIIFCGIPGCGKTVRAKKLAERLKKLGSVRLFISDKLRPPVYKKFFQLLKENLSRYNFLIFDGTFYKKIWRDKMKKIARREKVAIIHMDCSLKTALERNRKRYPRIPEKAVHIIFHQMEKPKNPEIFIDAEKLNVAQSAEKIFNFIKKQ